MMHGGGWFAMGWMWIFWLVLIAAVFWLIASIARRRP